MSAILQNANPIIYNISKEKVIIDNFNYDDEELREEVSSVEIFELIRHINDPEHPLTLEQLNVVSMDNIIVNDKENIIFL